MAISGETASPLSWAKKRDLRTIDTGRMHRLDGREPSEKLVELVYILNVLVSLTRQLLYQILLRFVGCLVRWRKKANKNDKTEEIRLFLVLFIDDKFFLPHFVSSPIFGN